MKFFLYIIFLLILTPCNGSKTLTGAVPGDTNNVTIIYQRAGCFGTCPAYTLTINGATNSMRFEGNKNVDKIGTYTKSISKEELSRIVETFEKNGFANLNDYYPNPISDFPHQYITYTNKGKTKKINDGNGNVKELKELETMLEKIANSDGWEKAAE